MIKTLLITGGTGFVGKGLVKLLLKKGYQINLLVREEPDAKQDPNLRTFKWDVYKGEIDQNCIENVDAIIHLAGEEIAAKRWTDERKKQIVGSRTQSIRMIYDLLRKTKNQVNHIISASAVGYYGDRASEFLTEESLPSKDFLAETCIAWEEAVDEGHKLGLRVVKLRSGIILAKNGGVLPQMNKPMQFGFGVIPGSGDQWLSWIHYLDALNVYAYALENESLKGAYNMVAPGAVTLEEMMRSMASAMDKTPIFVHTPEFALKIAIGEMSIMALASTKVSSAKLVNSGYNFKYPVIMEAMEEIYRNEESIELT
ncbi:TIGR01777 family oxidoreductase [Daejeonella sp.]|uniref:TIGR01777 family oxidoreductase n=1 Tax=Daejeonella sp. TaxID=2805397 RepID=UPI0039833BB7